MPGGRRSTSPRTRRYIDGMETTPTRAFAASSTEVYVVFNYPVKTASLTAAAWTVKVATVAQTTSSVVCANNIVLITVSTGIFVPIAEAIPALTVSYDGTDNTFMDDIGSGRKVPAFTNFITDPRFDLKESAFWLMKEQASAPSTPASGYGVLYPDNAGSLHYLNDAGLNFNLSHTHRTLSITYISGTGTAGADNTAQTVKSLTLPANSMTQVGDRLKIQVFWTGDTGAAITGTLKVGPAASEVTVAATTDAGGTSLQVSTALLHYIDNTHANVLEEEGGTLGNNSAVNVAGFTWDASQNILFTQDAIANNHIIVYEMVVDSMPKAAA